QAGVINAVAGEAVRIPFFGALDRAGVALLAVGSGGFTEDAFGKLGRDGGFLVANGLAAGDYRLLLKESGQAVTLRIADGERSAGYVFNPARILELEDRRPAHLVSAGVAGEAFVIEVANADKLTRVHVVATRFLPDIGLFGALGHAPRPGLFAGRPSRLPNLFLSGRKIGDEFRYVLERRYAQRLPGNMLERPEILLNPWQVRDTEAGEEKLAEGEEYKRKAPGEAAAKMQPPGAPRHGGRAAAGGSASVDFLAAGPAEMLNLQPGEDGKIEIPLEAFGDRQHVQVLVVDPDGASYQDVPLPDRGTAVRDLRLLAALDPARHFTEQDSVTLLKEGETLELPDILTAQFEVFEDLRTAYRYLLAMREDATLREFGFVVDWATLDDDEKRAKYSEFACHELSFFLAMKDPGFFKEIVAPYLANKRDRTFLDDYLLETNLGRYFEPYAYNRLNVLERILLARRTPGRIDGIRRDLADRLALVPPDLGRESSWFSGALATGGLSLGRKALMDEAKAALGARLEMEQMAAKPNAAPGVLQGRELANGRLQGKGMRRAAVDALADASPMPETESLRRIVDEKAVAFQAEAEALFMKQEGQTDAYGDKFDVDFDANDPFYRAIETTKEWAENNYYHLAIEGHTYNLVPEGKFWRDFAQHDGDGGFGSRYLGEATRNVHEMLLALAVLDLRFTAPESKTVIDGGKLTFTAGGPCVAFHRELKEAAMAENRPPLLVSQSYFRHGDRHRIENGEQVDKFVTDEFVAGVVYGGQVVVTNPTSSRQRLDVLVQIPKGAIPVMGHRATATQRIAMEPYT
ncbi:MAG: hypothetical protein HKO57_05590, partial [Akkermansiaceae bacterium]|nr:hypothetical protein [Akkermansiaceae bacterium]